MLTKTVKISHVTNLSDARYCAGMGVEMLGFSVDEDSPNYTSPKKFEDICSWLAGVTLVAETAQTKAEDILRTLADYPVHAVQVNEPSLLNYLHSELNLPMILRVSADQYEPDELSSFFSRYADQVLYFLLESAEGKQFTDEWINVCAELSEEYPILVGFGLDDENVVARLTEDFPKLGLALKGSDEIRPGYKDFGALMDILEALEEQ